MPPEANPFLGVRGIRLPLQRPALLYDQLVAFCRVARETSVSVMFPMVSVLGELLDARSALDSAVVDSGGRLAGLEVGIMVEVPTVAMKIPASSRMSTSSASAPTTWPQYTLAADRGNDAVAGLPEPTVSGVYSDSSDVNRSSPAAWAKSSRP